MLKSVELTGFKSFPKKTEFLFDAAITAIVGPNGSGKSNVAEGFRFVLGEQSMKSLRSKRGEDLIWGGSQSLSRQNRAAVKVTLDNSGKELDIEFDEVIIERVVHRDGQNEYMLNGSRVRLKDVVRLLAGANIGGSGYQIISQGEADRILNASPRERREMVEDALGLKLYQYKKAESERKLEETEKNLEKVQSLRRELAPHLKFLRRQVEKLERAREMKEELAVKLIDYLAREDAWLNTERTRLADQKQDITARVVHIEEQIKATQAGLPQKERGEEDVGGVEIDRLEKELAEARKARERLVRELGRAEARAEMQEEKSAESVSAQEVMTFADEIEKSLSTAQATKTLEEMREKLQEIAERVRALKERVHTPSEKQTTNGEVGRLQEELAVAQKKEHAVDEAIRRKRQESEERVKETHEAERMLLKLEGDKRDCASQMRVLKHALENLAGTQQAFEEEVREGIALLGHDADQWKRTEIPEGALSEERREQEKRRRDIERLKIKIEESGAGNSGEIMKEFKQTRERDEFLEREVDDLEQSAKSLRQIIEDLDNKIDERFRAGLLKINEALGVFFSRLFGGGTCKLQLEKKEKRTVGVLEDDEESHFAEGSGGASEELIRGLDIYVALPRKKVKGLEVLSGGERALTSIALIFAMSQVKPPPFLILDETDAALDEANSKRYADMVRELGKRSQLILITHNRATMAAAGELYGVTMGADGVSKVLSVKLEEAERVAK